MTETRPTRFHTERGELMPLGAWLRLPGACLRRVRGSGDEAPWIVPACVSYLAGEIGKHWRVLECGAGGSTAWFARRAGAVTSLEDDPSWHERVRKRLELDGLASCELRLVPRNRFPDAVAATADEGFDLVVVDGAERVACVAAAVPKLRPDGLLVLDDSDRAEYGAVDEMLRGWPVRRFVGVRPFPLAASETSVYRKAAT